MGERVRGNRQSGPLTVAAVVWGRLAVSMADFPSKGGFSSHRMGDSSETADDGVDGYGVCGYTPART